jgi:hypothetical protein
LAQEKQVRVSIDLSPMMNIHIPKWIIAAFVGAAPMLGIVFFILFSCTLLGLVQRCKISLTKSYANRRKNTTNDRSSLEHDDQNSAVLFNPMSHIVIISPFDNIPMKDIDAESSSKAHSEAKDDGEFTFMFDFNTFIFLFFGLDIVNSYKFRRNRSMDDSRAASDYDNSLSSIFNDNDYEQDRSSLIETSSQRKLAMKQTTSPETIINV